MLSARASAMEALRFLRANVCDWDGGLVDFGGCSFLQLAGLSRGRNILMGARFVTSRRRVLAGITAVAGSLALGRTALGMMDAPAGKPDDFVGGKSGGKIVPFPMTQVRLLDGLLKTQAEINQTY